MKSLRQAAKAVVQRDVVVKAVTPCGGFRIVCMTGTNLLNNVNARHGILQPHVAASDNEKRLLLGVTGQVLLFTNMMAALLDSEERFICKFHSPFGTPVCESLALGECRCYVNNTTSSSSETTPAEGSDPYLGVLHAQRILYNHSAPVTSATKLGNKPPEFAANIAPDVSNFMRQSEGCPAAVLLSTAIRSDNNDDTTTASASSLVRHCGGVMVQAIAPREESLEAVAARMGRLQQHFVSLCDATSGCIHHVPFVAKSKGSNDKDDEEVARASLESLDALLANDAHAPENTMLRALFVAAGCEMRQVNEVMKKVRAIHPQNGEKHDAAAITAERHQDYLVETLSPLTPNPRSDDSSAAQSQPALELDVTSVERTPIDFMCRCSAEGIATSIRGSLSEEQLEKLKSEHPNGVLPATCHHCGTVYQVTV